MDVGLLPEQREALQADADGVGVIIDGGDAEKHGTPVVRHLHQRVFHEPSGILAQQNATPQHDGLI